MSADGHEICSHGYRLDRTTTEERKHRDKALAILTELTGQRPLG